MPLHLYDTLSRSLKPVLPGSGNLLRFYCCGPTVYGPAHIGNFRTFLIQDVVRRVFEVDGVAVRHVRNITDVDDKTIRRSREEGRALAEFTAKWTDQFHADCQTLNMRPPDLEPGAVEHIPQQIDLIEKLVQKGFAYPTNDGSVYFSVTSFGSYGSLSRLEQRELKTGNGSSGGQRNQADEYARESVADFVLWKSRKPEDGENFWNSPWGEGRPGWHIECSAMIRSAFDGETIDLHGGGMDLCFPHHENEIAQSQCAYQNELCHHWFHSAHLMVEGEKMSKSLGNLHTLDDLRKKGFSPMAIRYALISGSYRRPLNFTFESLHAAQSALTRLERFAEKLLARSGDPHTAFSELYTTPRVPAEGFGLFSKAWEALCTNLNTAAALGSIFSVIASAPEEGLDEPESRQVLQTFGSLLYALGLRLFTVDPAGPTAPPEAITELAQRRWEAKQSKDWSESDKLRDALLAKGWTVRDHRDGFDIERTPSD